MNSHSFAHQPIGHRKGFTLVELMVVIVIVAILATFSAVALMRMKRRANSAAAVHSLHELSALVLGMASEQGKFPNEGSYPSSAQDPPADFSWDGYVLAYMGVTDIIQTTPPTVPVSYEGLFYHKNDTGKTILMNDIPTAKRSFVYLRVLSDKPLSSVRDLARTGMLGEHPWRTDNRNRVGFKSASFMDINALVPHPDSGNDLNPGGKFNFAFADGHVGQLTAKESAGKGSIARPKGLWTIEPRD